MPDVESTVIRITPHHPRRLDDAAVAALRSLTRLAFGHRRKQFQRILRDGLGLTEEDIARLTEITGFDLRARPETFCHDRFRRWRAVALNGGHRQCLSGRAVRLK
jgi:16S rRNA A1518/A1519 N6-dimethyltransferase RsmA/KsgA/DIM1 with predicted DNA glycosylase/AP lyase activity